MAQNNTSTNCGWYK